MSVTLLTPTGGRPEAFELCERWMARQTYRGEIQWLVADDCEPATRCTLGQSVVRPTPSWTALAAAGLRPQNTQFRNIAALLPLVRFDRILVIEDDDWYAPDWIETAVGWLDKAVLVGEAPARYYNVRTRGYFVHGNASHASLCQTAMRYEVLFTLAQICAESRWIDMTLWQRVSGRKLFTSTRSVGIKGMPGRPGQVAAHRNQAALRRMTPDPNLETLSAWIGEDVEAYRRFAI